MGLFNNSEKELAKQVDELKRQLGEAKKLGSKAEQSSRNFEMMLGEREAEASSLRKALGDRRDIPDGALSTIQIFIRLLGVALVISSLAFARSQGRVGNLLPTR